MTNFTELLRDDPVVVLPDGLEDLLRTRRLFRDVKWQDYVGDGENDRVPTDDLSIAEAASSQEAKNLHLHAVMFDIDHPAELGNGVLRVEVDGTDWYWWLPIPFASTAPPPRGWLIPSSTSGHHHLYLDVRWPWSSVESLLGEFARAGVVEQGYLNVSVKRGFTALRLPWVRKNDVSESVRDQIEGDPL